MARPSKYPPEFRERAVRIAHESERPIAAVARDPGVHHVTLRVSGCARTRPTTAGVRIVSPAPNARS